MLFSHQSLIIIPNTSIPGMREWVMYIEIAGVPKFSRSFTCDRDEACRSEVEPNNLTSSRGVDR